MEALRAAGVRFSLDDFGTGYSSLGYLKALPIDQLKIDQSFIADVPHDSDACAIVMAIISLAKSLDIGVIAEGVETVEQREYLLEHGCEIYQGYLFSHPISAGEFSRYAGNH
jgi:EAL domain-containing protein (putative c-di-GMP-specific phosphodiesterase class I)